MPGRVRRSDQGVVGVVRPHRLLPARGDDAWAKGEHAGVAVEDHTVSTHGMQAAPDAAEGGESGEAHLVKPDREYQHPAPLWRAYGACVTRARKKAAARRC